MSAKTFVVTYSNGEKVEYKGDSMKDITDELYGLGYEQGGDYSIEEAKPQQAKPKKNPKAYGAQLRQDIEDTIYGSMDAIFPSLRNTDFLKETTVGEDARWLARLMGEGATYPLRAAGGAVNLIAGNKRRGDYGVSDTYEESKEGYNPLMGIAQEILHDPMNAVGGTLGKGARAAKTGFDIAKNMALRPAAAGALQELGRPGMMETELSPENIAAAAMGSATFGMGLGAASKAIGAIAKKVGPKIGDLAAVGKKLLPFENKRKDLSDAKRELQVREDFRRFNGMTAAEILEDIQRHYDVRLDEFPNYARRRDIDLGKDLPIEVIADHFAAKNKISPQTLLKATSPKGLAEVERAYRSPLSLADEILEKIDPENLTAKDAAKWNSYIDEATKNGRKISTDDLFKIIREEAERVKRRGGKYPGDNATLGRLEGWLGPLTSKKGKPLDVDPWKLYDFRQRIGNSVNWDVLEANGFSKDEINIMKRAYGTARDKLLDDAKASGADDAVSAYERMASDYALRDNVLRVLGAGNIKDAQRSRIATMLKNRGNLNDSNAPKTEELFEILQNLDKRLGTDITKRSKNAYYANQLSPEGEEFRLPDYNPNVTGKSYSADPIEGAMQGSTIKSAFIETARAKAKAMNNTRAANKAVSLANPKNAVKDFLKSVKGPAVYERPELTPRQQRDYQIFKETFGEKAAEDWRDSLGTIDFADAGRE